jgi:hypothetical protein
VRISYAFATLAFDNSLFAVRGIEAVSLTLTSKETHLGKWIRSRWLISSVLGVLSIKASALDFGGLSVLHLYSFDPSSPGRNSAPSSQKLSYGDE